MTKVSVVGPDEAENIRLGPGIQMQVLEDGRTTGHRLGIAINTVQAHTPGPPQHRHLRHDEGFYVISGLLRFTVGQDDYDVSAGTLVTVPPGAPHTFANPTDEPATMLTTFTPDLYVQYFRDLAERGGVGALDRSVFEEVMARYATEFSTEYAPDASPDIHSRGPQDHNIDPAGT